MSKMETEESFLTEKARKAERKIHNQPWDVDSWNVLLREAQNQRIQKVNKKVENFQNQKNNFKSQKMSIQFIDPSSREIFSAH